MAEGNGQSPEIEMPWLKEIDEKRLQSVKNGGKVDTNDPGYGLGLPSLQNIPPNPSLQKAGNEIDKSRGSRK